jgi:RND family efflux transporter MFP subunit
MLALPLTLAGCYARNAYVPPPPPEVLVARPTRDRVIDYVYFTGTTQASESVEIRARVQGYLDSIHFTDGADVKKGDLLFVIDRRPFVAKLDAARADLESRKAKVESTSAVYRRTLQLYRNKSASREQVDVDKGNWEVAKADQLQAEANLREARLNLDFTEVRAPISGRIGRRQVDVGNLVVADNTLLTTLARYDPMYAYFTVSENDLLRFSKRRREQRNQPSAEDQAHDMPLTVASAVGLLGSPGGRGPLLAILTLKSGIGRRSLDLKLADEEDYSHKGYLNFTDIGVDPATGTYLVRGSFPNSDRALYPGLFVRIRGAIDVRERALLVPERALGSDQEGKYVLVVNRDNVVESRKVTLGPVDRGRVVIEKGLKSGEWVIVEGLQRVRSGDKVTPKRSRPSPDGKGK